jgi:hypothetical protein
MRRPVVIYDFAPDPFLISFYVRKILLNFLSVYLAPPDFHMVNKLKKKLTFFTMTMTISMARSEESSVADPVPFCPLDPGSEVRDPGWVKSQVPDPGSGMNNPDHNS